MKKNILCILTLFFILVNAQNRIAKKRILSSYNKNSFQSLNNRIKQKQFIDSILIDKYVRENNTDSSLSTRITRITEGGLPKIIKSNSLSQINSTHTNEIITGGVGLNLSGEGLTSYIFDEGKIRDTHTEFESRVSNVAENKNLISEHPTFVAGVMGAKGNNPNARGMANKLMIVGDTFEDGQTLLDRINRVAQNGSLVSNHSYGYPAGWYEKRDGWHWYGDDNISETEDYEFGYYGEDDYFTDEIIYNSNYHSFVKAASNDNNTKYSNNLGSGPGKNTTYFLGNTNSKLNTGTNPRNKNCGTGFDCIPSGNIGKNIITVGSVFPLQTSYTNPEQVQLSYFSSVGPTDDGRIKPDVVAVGNDVLSTCVSNDNCYEFGNGTSFSAPSVTGIIALLQELYERTHDNQFMRSDLVKALLIHTANEAGKSDGPDYTFGWGLVDAYKASQIIENEGTEAHLQESELFDSFVCKNEILAPKGKKVKVTLTWIDDPGYPIPYGKNMLNNRTKMLQNDLDIRVEDQDDIETIYYPWVLNVNTPSAAATRGDNNTDNVEQIEFIADNPSGKYKIYVTHKKKLVNPTKYALVINTPLVSKECEQIQMREIHSTFLLNEQELRIDYPFSNAINNYELSIYDFFGKQILSTKKRNYTIQLKEFNLSPGAYIVLIKSSGQTYSSKFIIK